VLSNVVTEGCYKKLKWSRCTPWMALGDRRYSSYSILTSALEEGEWSASRPGRALPPRKGPPVRTLQKTGWAPEPVYASRLQKKTTACRVSNPRRPVRSRSLYLLSYPAHERCYGQCYFDSELDSTQQFDQASHPAVLEEIGTSMVVYIIRQ
jgi:hypothetical protein